MNTPPHADIYFDKLLIQPMRLRIVAHVHGCGRAVPFSDLQRALGIHAGSLSWHLQRLERAGYVRLRRKFCGTKPQTSVCLMEVGRAALDQHKAGVTTIAGAAGS
jgi:DNA-binding transcriptional ArsR family regulator